MEEQMLSDFDKPQPLQQALLVRYSFYSPNCLR